MLALFLNLNTFHAALHYFNQEYKPYLSLAVVQVKELLFALFKPYLHSTPVSVFILSRKSFATLHNKLAFAFLFLFCLDAIRYNCTVHKFTASCFNWMKNGVV